MTEPLLVLTGCRRCGDARRDGLYGHGLCGPCWHACGQPWPEPVASLEEVHDAELRIRDHMLARGGEQRYRVIAGKT